MAATIPTNGIVLSSGLNVDDGDVVMASGHGISFAATGGPTNTSELFDDYEEGQWSPVVSDGTNDATMSSGSDKCWYTKNGRIVTIGGYLGISSKGSIADAQTVRIHGLPFAVPATSSSNEDYTAVTNGAYVGGVASGMGTKTIGFYTEKNTSYLQGSVQDQSTGSSSLRGDEITASFAIMIGGSYKTDL